MLASKNLCIRGSLAALLLILAVPVQAISPVVESETYLEIETETAGEMASIRIWLSPNAIRIDADPQAGICCCADGEQGRNVGADAAGD